MPLQIHDGPSAPLPFPAGPRLIYVSSRGPDPVCTNVDEQAVDDARERRLCRALLTHALEILDKAEDRSSRIPAGFQAPKGTP